jgi:hypothetical protein
MPTTRAMPQPSQHEDAEIYSVKASVGADDPANKRRRRRRKPQGHAASPAANA